MSPSVPAGGIPKHPFCLLCLSNFNAPPPPSLPTPPADTHPVSADPHSLVERIEQLPVIPAVAARVLSLDDDATSAAEVADTLSADPVLTTTLLKVSNSAYYGFARQVSTVREAVMLLGFKQVRQIALGASVIRSWRYLPVARDGFDMDLFWGHSMTVALMAETASRKFNTGRPEEAFTAGILHDVGTLVLRQALPEQFRAALREARLHGVPLCDSELQFTGFTHAGVGAALAERWQLPSRLVDAVGRHHHALLDPTADGLAGAIGFADQIAEHHGLQCGYASDGALPTRDLSPRLTTLEIACGGIASVLDRAHAFITSVSGAPTTWYSSAPTSSAA